MSIQTINASSAAALLSSVNVKPLRTIKGTATNKSRARVWLEVPQAELMPFGFARGEHVTITLHADAITVELDPAGKRKVAGRARGGRTICILDICFDATQRDAMFHGAAELLVSIEPGRITITAAGVQA